MQRIEGLMRRAIQDYSMIENNDKIAIALSGGKDSITLLYCLKNLQRYFEKKFEIIAISVNPGFNDFNEELLKRTCEKVDVELFIWRKKREKSMFTMC